MLSQKKNYNEKSNCKNCGAPIEHRYNHRCPYCGTFQDFSINKIKEIDYRGLRDIEFSYMKYDLESDMYILVFQALYRKTIQELEYTTINDSVSATIDADCLKSEKISLAIKISKEKWRIPGPVTYLESLPCEVEQKNIIEAVNKIRKVYNLI